METTEQDYLTWGVDFSDDFKSKYPNNYKLYRQMIQLNPFKRGTFISIV